MTSAVFFWRKSARSAPPPTSRWLTSTSRSPLMMSGYHFPPPTFEFPFGMQLGKFRLIVQESVVQCSKQFCEEIFSKAGPVTQAYIGFFCWWFSDSNSCGKIEVTSCFKLFWKPSSCRNSRQLCLNRARSTTTSADSPLERPRSFTNLGTLSVFREQLTQAQNWIQP